MTPYAHYAREKGYELCSSCGDLEGCTRFEWLRDYGREFRELLKGESGAEAVLRALMLALAIALAEIYLPEKENTGQESSACIHFIEDLELQR